MVEYHENPQSILLEFAPFGSLAKQARQAPFSDDECIQILQQSLLALKYLHNRQEPLVHRDIKPDNILVQTRHPLHIKFSDFGLSKITQDFLKTQLGTSKYMAPEVHHRERYGTPADIWSLGIVVFELACRGPDWRNYYDEPLRWCKAIAKAAEDAVSNPDCSPLVRVVASCMLLLDPEVRCSAEQLCDMVADMPVGHVQGSTIPLSPEDLSSSYSNEEGDSDSDVPGAITPRARRSLASPSSSVKRRTQSADSASSTQRQHKQQFRPSTTPTAEPTPAPVVKGFEIFESDWLQNSMWVGSEVANMGHEAPEWSEEDSSRVAASRPAGSLKKQEVVPEEKQQDSAVPIVWTESEKLLLQGLLSDPQRTESLTNV